MAQKRSPITQSSTRCRLATSTTSSWRARRPHPASLPVRVPTVAPLPCASFDSRSHDPLLALRLRLPPPVPMISFHIISSDPCRAHQGPASGGKDAVYVGFDLDQA